MNAAPVRAVLFDYYFTLAHPESPESNAAAAALLDGADHGAVLTAWRAMRVPDVERALDGESPAFRRLGTRWAEHGDALFATLGLSFDGAHWETCRAASHAHAPLFDDVRPVIDVLRAAGAKVGVLSDADAAWLHESIDRSGLDLDAIVCSEELRCYKPHRAAFLAAADGVGVRPGECAYVGDNPRADVVGGRNVGMTTVWINRFERTWPSDLDPPDHALTTLADLPAALGLG